LGALPRISIVTPSFNQAAFLEETISSVVSQGYPDLDYVVVDGGSSDDSVSVIKRHSDKIASWVSEPDGGHADAINKGFASTTGEIMAWINSSDIYYPWTLETVATIFRHLPQVEWIQGVQSHVDVGAQPKAVGQGFCNRYDLLAGHRVIQQESVFWRRSLWEKTGGCLDDALRLACDYELWLRFSRHAPLHHVGTLLAAFRYHDDSRGSVQRHEYRAEAKRVRGAERVLLTERERSRVALVERVGRSPLRPAPTLLAKSGLLPWYRYARVDYDFATHRWMAT
jgi:glycosyltransferase involved in cell wall biosynthesis